MYKLMQESKTNYACIICGAEFYFNGANWAKDMHHLLVKHTQIEYEKLQDKLSRRNKLVAYLREEHAKRGEEIKELKEKITYYKGHAGAALIGNELARKEALQDIINR